MARETTRIGRRTANTPLGSRDDPRRAAAICRSSSTAPPGRSYLSRRAAAPCRSAYRDSLSAKPAFGADGFQYCGNILTAAPGHPRSSRGRGARRGAGALAQAVVEEFGLVGVNGIDFIARDGVPWAIEVNPRWCASMELVERAYGLSVFEAHASACTCGLACRPSICDRARSARGRGRQSRHLRAARRHRRRYTYVVDETRKHPRYPAARRAHFIRTAGLHDPCRRSGRSHLP